MEYALKHRKLGLAYGAIDGDAKRGVDVGQRIRTALETAGLRVTWTGSIKDKLNITRFNWQRRSKRLERLTLTVEDRPDLKAPTIQQIQDAVDALTPRGGPGFLILGSSKDYAQTAGGKGVFTVEWREHSGRKFRHWVAGLTGRPSKKNVAIPTNGFKVTVKENERLSAADVKAILGAFAEKKPRPEKYAWRDITERFA